MAIQLPPDLESKIHSFVDGANYRTPADVVDAALNLLSDRKKPSLEKFHQLREEIAVGIAEADRGELLDAEDVFDDIERQLGEKSDDQA